MLEETYEVREQANVRHEDAGVHVDAVLHIEVIATIGLRDIAICIRQVPLPSCGACIVARRGLRVEAKLRHQASAHVVVVEVAAYAKLGYLNLTRAKDLARSADRVVLRMAEIVRVVNVRAYLGCEEFGCVRSILCTGVAIEPGEVGEGEWLGLWIVWVSYFWLRLGKCGWRSGGLRRCDVMCLWLGCVGLLQLYQFLLDLLQLVLQLLDLLVLRCLGILDRCCRLGVWVCASKSPALNVNPTPRVNPIKQTLLLGDFIILSTLVLHSGGLRAA